MTERKLDIGIVTPEYPPGVSGGGGDSVRLLVENLRQRGHNVEVLSFNPRKEEKRGYVERVEINSNRLDIMNFKARKHIAKFSKSKDIIHSHNMNLNPAVGSIANTRTVSVLNDYYFLYPYKVEGVNNNPKSRLYRTIHDLISRFFIRKIDSFVAISKEVKEIYSKKLPEEKIQVIPEMLDPNFGKHVDIDTNENEILYVGRLEEKKGLSNLVKQMKNLPEYSLTIDGKGSCQEELEREVEDLGLEDQVDVNGYVEKEKLLEHYSRAGWFVHPGIWPEPFGRTILEAMQMDTPILATKKGGPKDVLPEEQLMEDISELKRKLEDLDRNSIVESQKSITENYRPEKIINSYEEFYIRVLQE